MKIEIIKVKARRWSGRYIPACYRVDQINELGQHTARLGVFDTLQEAENFVANLLQK